MSPIPLTAVEGLNRPHRNLLKYYVLMSLLAGPFFPLVLIPLYFRYHTLHYRFDDQGISMRWGIVFRREISLTYARLQDIHLQSNLLERWLGLARVQLQTASGSSGAEMTIEGLQQFEQVRDFLYSRMRGARSRKMGAGALAPSPAVSAPSDELASVVEALEAVASELAAIRRSLLSERGMGTERRS